MNIFLVSGCASVNNYVQDINIISIDDEKQIGASLAKEVAKQKVIVTDPSSNLQVNSISTLLLRALPQKDFDYEFFVIEDNTPNAFTIPGGKIYVHTGLLNFTNNAELSGVLAHEIAHAVERHPTKSLTRIYGISALTNKLFSGNPEGIKLLTMKLIETSIFTKYGRNDEFEADELGFEILRKAKIETNGLHSFLQKLQSLEKKGSSFQFLSSHPPTPDRIEQLELLEKGQA